MYKSAQAHNWTPPSELLEHALNALYPPSTGVPVVAGAFVVVVVVSSVVVVVAFLPPLPDPPEPEPADPTSVVVVGSSVMFSLAKIFAFPVHVVVG